MGFWEMWWPPAAMFVGVCGQVACGFWYSFQKEIKGMPVTQYLFWLITACACFAFGVVVLFSIFIFEHARVSVVVLVGVLFILCSFYAMKRTVAAIRSY